MWTKRNILKTGAAVSVLGAMPQMMKATNPPSKPYHIPDEGARHELTFMQYPVSRKVYDDALFLEDVQHNIAKIANAIADFEPVVVLMDKAHQKEARSKFSSTIAFWDIPTDDLWARDAIPVFGVNGDGKRLAVNLNFNGWGNRQAHQNDGKIAQRLAEMLDITLLDSGLVGEAGGVDYNGHGLLIAHESSWVNPNRNKGSKAEIEAKLLKAYQAEKLVWAKGVYDEDITDYHIDSLARFVGENEILIQLPEIVDPSDPFSIAAYDTYNTLLKATTKDGGALKLHVIPEPKKPRIRTEDFVASYVNYYLCNDAVMVSQFGDSKADNLAYDILSDLFPAREIVTMNVDALGELGGGIHCATHELPKV